MEILVVESWESLELFEVVWELLKGLVCISRGRLIYVIRVVLFRRRD